MMNEQMREAFEATYKVPKYIQFDGNSYRPISLAVNEENMEIADLLNIRWKAWQAALSRQSEAQPVFEIGYGWLNNNPQECYLPFGTNLYLAPPSAKAIETAALMKAEEVVTCHGVGERMIERVIADEILALITPEGKTALEEFGIKCIEVALQLPEHLRIQHNLRASVKQVMEGEKW